MNYVIEIIEWHSWQKLDFVIEKNTESNKIVLCVSMNSMLLNKWLETDRN